MDTWTGNFLKSNIISFNFHVNFTLETLWPVANICIFRWVTTKQKNIFVSKENVRKYINSSNSEDIDLFYLFKKQLCIYTLYDVTSYNLIFTILISVVIFCNYMSYVMLCSWCNSFLYTVFRDDIFNHRCVYIGFIKSCDFNFFSYQFLSLTLHTLHWMLIIAHITNCF